MKEEIFVDVGFSQNLAIKVYLVRHHFNVNRPHLETSVIIIINYCISALETASFLNGAALGMWQLLAKGVCRRIINSAQQMWGWGSQKIAFLSFSKLPNIMLICGIFLNQFLICNVDIWLETSLSHIHYCTV